MDNEELQQKLNNFLTEFENKHKAYALYVLAFEALDTIAYICNMNTNTSQDEDCPEVDKIIDATIEHVTEFKEELTRHHDRQLEAKKKAMH